MRSSWKAVPPLRMRRDSSGAGVLVSYPNDEARLNGLFVDMRVEHCVLEFRRRIRIDEDTCAAVLDHEITFERLVPDGVIPRLVDGRMGAGRDPEPGSATRILTDDEFDDGADCFRR
jgi:hypothetical protein